MEDKTENQNKFMNPANIALLAFTAVAVVAILASDSIEDAAKKAASKAQDAAVQLQHAGKKKREIVHMNENGTVKSIETIWL